MDPQEEIKPFADPLDALKSLAEIVSPFLELHRHGARGEHDALFEKLYEVQARLAATAAKPAVVNVCHTVGDDVITGGYLTFAYADGRSVSHPLDLFGAAMLLRGQIDPDPARRTRWQNEQQALLERIEARLAERPR